jgi:hypothetical protein
MKALPIIALLVVFGGFQAVAQTATEKSNYPYHTISKDVQKIQFKNVEHVPAKITMTSPAMTQTKGTAQILAKNEGTERKMVRVGYPAWTISKGVARRQFEKNQSK